ncbi:MAG: ABC transporter ATP-binding protein [Candidatus Saccharimonadales bacterium]
MPTTHSSKRIVGFLFGLWRVAPAASWSMIGTQIVFSALTTTIAPIFVSQLLTRIASGSATLHDSMGLLIGYAIILFLGDVVAVRVTIALAFIAETKMQAAVSTQILSHLTAKSLGYHADRMSGGTVSDTTKLVGSVERFWDTLIFTAVPITTTIISVCIALSFLFWQYAVVLAVLSIIIIFTIIKAQTAIAPISRKSSEKFSAATAYLADVVSNITTVKAFARSTHEHAEYGKRIKVWRKASMKEMKSVLIITGSFGAMMTVMNISALLAAVLATEYHLASIGVTYLMIVYTLNVVSQLWAVSSTTRAYQRILGDAGPMISTLDDPIELKDPESPQPLVVSKGKIDFDNITFTHAENDDALFKDFTLTIAPGERIGLVGRSGSGKTSLTRLLLRFNDIENGAITIDDQPINQVTQNDLRQTIAYVAQEPVLFHRSLRDNIAYANPDATDKQIEHAIRQANAYDFIQKLPKGLDTIVGERGVKLSGGQRQRIAIARAILKDAPILVLDEATSALDSESEKLIQDALKHLMKNRTSIVIAHRLSTIASLDRIIVLDNGQIIEQGSHSNLLTKNGIYAKLWNHQSGGFIEE